MMNLVGVFYAILSTLFLGSNKLAVRKSLFGMDESYATLISIVVSVPIFGLPLLIFGVDLKQLTLPIIIIFVLIGLTNYAGGRYFIYKSISLIGANRGNILASSQIVYAILIAILFLNQRVDMFSAIGIALVLLGILIISFRSTSIPGGITSKQLRTGLIFGLIGGFFWGIAQDLMQIGIASYNDPVGATFFTYLSSLAGMLPIVLVVQARSERKETYRIDKKSLIFVTIAGLLGSFGQYYRYVSLQVIPVTVVATINGTNPMVTMILSYFLIRQFELFDRRTIFGIISSVIGVALVAF